MQSRVLAILVAVVLAMVATAALVVYVNGADRRAISGQQPRLVWVAAETIRAGTSGQTARNTRKIKQVAVPNRNVVAGAVVSMAQIEKRYAAVDIETGEQLIQKRWVGAEDVAGGRLLQIEPGHQALAIEMDLVRQVAGFVTPGDKVSLVLSMKRPAPGGGGDLERSQFLLQNVQVLAVGATALANAAAQGGGSRVNQGRGEVAAVTLSIPETDVERVVYAAEHGSIYMTLLAPEAKDVPSDGGATADNVIGAR
ncbi:MAG TPA: Flp pilus assembly protein CpaB [Actinomycetes bacterium]|nr:Flp pilus assembly protein CpaB [Actinomycetes bacterium]